MPTPTIPKGELYFNATTYTGNGGTLTVTNGAPGQSFQPDFVWIKRRDSGAESHKLNDSVRGINKQLMSNSTDAEYTNTDQLTSFNSNGFTTGASGTTNGNGTSLVAWQWKAGGAAVTNTAGSISAQVSANPTAGFSIVTWTGNGVTAATVGHGLGAIPAMIICKERTGTDYWHVKHQSTASNTNLFLNQTLASTSAASVGDGILANLSSSTTFGFATAGSPGNVVAVNENGITNVAYCWSEVAGFSKFGSYTGNGSTDGPFVYLGFRPRWVMIKRTTLTSSWRIFDTARDSFNVSEKGLFPDLTNAETTGLSYYIDFLSNGLKLRSSDAGFNSSGDTFIYAAYAENPFKYASAR